MEAVNKWKFVGRLSFSQKWLIVIPRTSGYHNDATALITE